MKGPAFEKDCDIEFETDPTGAAPRYLLNRDYGYSGKWARGIVLEIRDVYIRTIAEYPDGETREINWPNHASTDYENGQWGYPGYLRRVGAAPPECECGYGNNSGVHWNFCPRGQWNEREN